MTDPRASAVDSTYLGATRTATYGFLSALPLLVLYEVMIVAANAGQSAQVRIGAELWLKRLFMGWGVSAPIVTAVAAAGIGTWVLLASRGHRPPLRTRYFVWLVGESAAYAVVLAVVVSRIVAALLLFAPDVAGGGSPAWMVPQAVGGSLFRDLALSIGAGLYEELLFRVVLVGGLYLLIQRVAPRFTAYAVAAVVGAIVFSAVHYIGPLGDAFELRSFVYRMLFGLALNGLFLARGFGVAAWTHALYDVMVVTQVLG